MAKRKASKRRPTKLAKASGKPSRRQENDPLLREIRGLIEESRQQVARTVNSALVWLYWNIGKRIREDVLQERRAVMAKRSSPHWGEN